MTLTVRFMDSGRSPKCPPDPTYPYGMDVDVSDGATKTCSVDVTPYPAPRCGIMVVECDACGAVVALTVAGRTDDPRNLKLACYFHKLDGRPLGVTEIRPPTTFIRTPAKPKEAHHHD